MELHVECGHYMYGYFDRKIRNTVGSYTVCFQCNLI